MPNKLRGFGLLTPIQKAFLSAFASLPDQSQFFLAGGTALSEYYFGHRLSFDVDIFTGVDGLVLPTSYQVEKTCVERGLQVHVVRRFSSFVQFLVIQGQDSLKVDMAFDSPYRFESPVLTELGVYVNDYADLRVDKLLAYFGRAEPRDAVDLYFIMEKEPLRPLLEQAAQKDPGFDLYWFAIALNRAESFPDKIERWPVKMLKPVDPLKIKDASAPATVTRRWTGTMLSDTWGWPPNGYVGKELSRPSIGRTDGRLYPFKFVREDC